jgi:hypothetical protein
MFLTSCCLQVSRAATNVLATTPCYSNRLEVMDIGELGFFEAKIRWLTG